MNIGCEEAKYAKKKKEKRRKVWGRKHAAIRALKLLKSGFASTSCSVVTVHMEPSITAMNPTTMVFEVTN